jgi:hypothetical protein
MAIRSSRARGALKKPPKKTRFHAIRNEPDRLFVEVAAISNNFARD